MLPSPLGVEVKRGWIGEAFYEVFQGVQMRDEIDVVEAEGSFIIYSHKFEFDVVGGRKKETKEKPTRSRSFCPWPETARPR